MDFTNLNRGKKGVVVFSASFVASLIGQLILSTYLSFSERGLGPIEFSQFLDPLIYLLPFLVASSATIGFLAYTSGEPIQS